MKLYNAGLSPNGAKVIAVANELGIELEIVEVNLREGEGQKPEYLTKNPNGKVPVLEDGDFILWESNAIITYLASLKPEKGLISNDLKERANIDKWLHWQGTHLYPNFSTLAAELFFKKLRGEEPNQANVQKATKELNRYVNVLNKELEGKEYVCGNLSVVDFSLASTLFSAVKMSYSMDDYPNANNWLKRVSSKDSFQKSLPAQMR